MELHTKGQIGNLLPDLPKIDKNAGHKAASELTIKIAETIGEKQGKIFSLTRGWSAGELNKVLSLIEKDPHPRIAFYKYRKERK